MKRLHYILLLIISVSILTSMKSHAQYITLPDANFASFIATTYPAAVNGSNQLDTNVAKTITGTFDASNKNISNVSGVEYFININQLRLTGNQLTSLPSGITRLTNLTRLHVDGNDLTTLPDLHVMTSLQVLWCHDNDITVLPSMANMTSVEQFFCHDNQLTSLPDITGMTGLIHFICSDNLITALPDMSTLISLNRFLCSNNKLTSADITSIPNVTQVHLRYNNFVNFPTITGMTQLTELLLDHNKFTTLPDLSSFVNLNNVRLDNNLLTFEDLLPLASMPGFSGFTIAPQGLVGTADTTIVKENKTFNYSTGVDLSVASNTYTWFRNGVQIASGTTPNFSIPSVQFSDAGDYTFQIKNTTPSFTSLTLTSQPMKLQVITCMDLSYFQYTYQQESCQAPVRLNIDENTVQNAAGPITYQLKNIIDNSTRTYTSPSISLKNFGLYELTVLDSTNCSVTLPYKLEIDKKPGCDLVIYPDLEGSASSYFVNQQGKASVYTSSGQKIKDLTLPAYWDGKDQQGRIVDSGLYMIIVNEQINIPISIMRTQ